MITLMRAQAETKQLQLSADLIGHIPPLIVTDPTRLRQILLNLVGNAIKFTDEGTIRVEMRMLWDDVDRTQIEFAIIDSGIGMTPRQVESLFIPFTQADSSTTRRFGGTGLGLTISGRLAQLLGGDIVVDSTQGHGSTFRLTVETGAVSHVESNVRRSLAELAPTHAPEPAHPIDQQLDCRVLLAEDGIDNQRLFGYLLGKMGADVSVVENGEQACQLVLRAEANGTPFDLILMDMQMPIMDGYDAVSRLRREGCTSRIVALTAFTMDGDRKKCLDAGCNAYLMKPIEREVFVSTVVEQVTGMRGSECGMPSVQ